MSTPQTDVTSEAELAAAINAANIASPGTALAPIVLENDIAIGSALPTLSFASGVTVTIESAVGQDYAIDGGGLVIDSGGVTLSSIQLTDDLAAGVDGTGGDGGGPGLGGGLFVGSGATVTLDDVKFVNDRAVGGAGGTGNLGSLGQAGNSGHAGSGGQGGIGGKPYSAGGLGSFGGGGGGGIGGQGGRGGATTLLPNPMGTGGTPVFLPGTSGMAGGKGGKGGFGGGAGGDGGHGAGSQGPIGGTGGQAGGGGGGLGAGGDIFVQSGGKLLIEGGTLTGGSATGGQGGAGGDPGVKGQGYGSGIFLQGTSAIVFDPSATQSVVVDDVIADMTGSKDASGLTGALTLDMNGPGLLVLKNGGNTFTGGVELDDGTLTLGAATAAGSGDITFGAVVSQTATLSLAFAVPVGGATFSNYLDNFGVNDSIDLAGLKYTGAGPYTQIAVNNAGALIVSETGGTETFNLVTPNQQTFYAKSDGIDGTLISAACYGAGTRILTGRGEIPIEALSVGEVVVTASGPRRPVVWIGHRRIDVARHPDPAAVRPVRVLAGAFGEGLPHRDLWLSPDHSVACAGSLIPISCLINGRSVAQVDVDWVDYWHVELDAHDVILAEGLPAESYLDTGNRTAFSNGGAFVAAHPDFRAKHWTDTCLPMALEGPAVIATKARLLARLAAQSVSLSQDADAHIEIDGLRVGPVRLSETRLAFVLPSGGRQIALKSRRFVPAHCLAQNMDSRQLGVCVGAMQIDGEPLALEDEERYASGWHEAEHVGGRFSHRWTAGSTPLPTGARLVILDLAGVGYYWRDMQGEKVVLLA